MNKRELKAPIALIKDQPTGAQIREAFSEFIDRLGEGLGLTSTGAGTNLTLTGAPDNASYVTIAAESGLTSERVLAVGTALTLTDGGPNSTATITLDQDLIEIAAVNNVRGDLLVTDSGPTWVRLAVGSASTLLKSDGTDPSWGTVNLLSAFHGDTTTGTVARGDLITGQGASPTWTRLAKDANATRYLSNTGTANEPAWAQVNLANGVTGVLPLANGGSNKALTASNGGIVWTDADSMEVLAGTATAGQILRSGATATPTWSTATYPATAGTTGNLLVSDGTNWASGIQLAGLYEITNAGSLDIFGGFSCIDAFSYIKKSTDMTKYFQFSASALTTAQVYHVPNVSGTAVIWESTTGAMPASGSMLYGPGSSIGMSELTIGSAGKIMTSGGSAPQWSTNASVVDIARSWTTLQTFPDNTIKVVGSTTSSKELLFELDGATASKTVTLTSNHTLDRTITLPDATCTLSGLSVSETWTGVKTYDSETAGTPLTITGSAIGTDTYLRFTDTNSGFAATVKIDAATGLTANRTITIGDVSGTFVFTTATQTLTNKRITQRVVSMTDATSFTPTGDTADLNTQANTQAAGTLTANAPSGTPTSGQLLRLRIKSTNVQTFSWNGIYRGGTVALPTATTGSSKTDYYQFIYNSTDSKWDFISQAVGF